MRAPKLLLDVAAWRWSPTVALLAGSLAYVASAVIAIPDRIGGDGESESESSIGAFSALRANTMGRLEPSVSANIADKEGEAETRTAALRRQAPVSMAHAAANKLPTPRLLTSIAGTRIRNSTAEPGAPASAAPTSSCSSARARGYWCVGDRAG